MQFMKTTVFVVFIYGVCGLIVYVLMPALPYPVDLGLGLSGFTRETQAEQRKADTELNTVPKYIREVDAIPFSTREWMSESRTVDWYEVKANFPAGTVLYVKATPSQELDIQVALVNDMGKSRVCNTGEKGVSEGLEIECEPGRAYNIAVEYLSGSGFYTLDVKKGGTNFSIDKFPFSASNAFTASDIQASLWHIYTTQFDVPEGAVLHVVLKCKDTLDAAVVLEDATGNVWIEDKNRGGESETTDYRVQTTGPVNVIIYGDDGEGSYDLDVSLIRMEFAIGKLPFKAAHEMTEEDARTGRWHWYETLFDVPKGTTIRADLYVPISADLDLTIVDAGTKTVESTNRGLGKHERAELTVETVGHVVIIVDNVRGEGEYNLTIKEIPPRKKPEK